MTGVAAAHDIAVVMPVLNAERTLRRALDSIAKQSGAVDIVLIDGGSHDATWSIATSSPGVRAISAPGSSIYEAINRGIAETSRAAVALVNADDVLLPGAFAAWSEALARDRAAGVARGQPEFLLEDADGTLAPQQRDRRDIVKLSLDLVLRGPCAINALCIRRAAFDRIGLFDPRYRIAADRDWMLRAWLARERIVEIAAPVYRYIAHPGSLTLDPARRSYAAIRREHLTMAESYLARRDLPADVATAIRTWHAAETAMLSLDALRSSRWGEIVRVTSRAFRVSPGWPGAALREFGAWRRGRR
jgi:glycosyltransferase involved in cell wall biosynthesis